MTADVWSWSYYLLILVFLQAAPSHPAFAVDRNAVKAQVDLGAMSDQALIMQQSMDESFASTIQLLQQNSDEMTKVWERLPNIQKNVQMEIEKARLDPLTQELVALARSTREADASLEKIEDQAQALGSEIGEPAQAVSAIGQAPPPRILFRNAMEDYNAGHYKLAKQEFAQYMEFYSGTDQAAQAQFYLADSEYWEGDYHSSLKDLDALEQQYPATEPATVELKQGLCLMKLGELDAAKTAFRRIIHRYPNSVEALDALSAMGHPGSGPS